jgi:hypothetical protein
MKLAQNTQRPGSILFKEKDTFSKAPLRQADPDN